VFSHFNKLYGDKRFLTQDSKLAYKKNRIIDYLIVVPLAKSKGNASISFYDSIGHLYTGISIENMTDLITFEAKNHGVSLDFENGVKLLP
jgi:hypothetical protein